MTITSAHVMNYYVQVSMVLTLVPHMRVACTYRMTIYMVTIRPSKLNPTHTAVRDESLDPLAHRGISIRNTNKKSNIF